jgi:aspartate/methionine/tyrosine aminotransferase
VTGFKVGWAIGPAELVRGVRSAHQFMTFATATAMQHGALAALTHAESAGYVRGLVEQFARGREFLSAGLREIGFKVFEPAGAYFVMVDWTGARVPGLGLLGDAFADDAAFCKHITEHAKVAAIPPSVFYQNKQHGRGLARFAFCKKAETLREGVLRLKRWAGAANS